MNFKTRQKLHKFKKQGKHIINKIISIAVKPLEPFVNLILWCEDRFYLMNRKRLEHKIKNLSCEKVVNVVAKRIVKELLEDSEGQYEFYICKSDFMGIHDEYNTSLTVIDYILDNFEYEKKYIYKVVDCWASSLRWNSNNKLNIDRELTELLNEKLSQYEDLDVHWECEILNYWCDIKDYEKHLVIKVKQ